MTEKIEKIEGDYIVVGAGSSGAALAARLSERTKGTVILLEAGGVRHRDFWVRTPIGFAKTVGNPNYVWPLRTVEQKAMSGQKIYWPRGRMLGGSSGVNGMIFVRGDPSEFDHWRQLGNPGWSWDDVLPYFKRFERTEIGSDEARGRSGPIHISSVKDMPDPLSDAFHAACVQAGIPANDDYNGGVYEGVCYLQLNTRNGQRCDTATAYLNGTKQPNLRIVTEAQVSRVLFQGRRAVGVEYEVRGEKRRAMASREVILSAGPIKSPHILELSGVGQADRLRVLDIPVVHDLPGVGEHLIDHLQSRMTFESRNAFSLNTVMGRRLREYLMGMKYLATRKGPMATPSFTVHALARTDDTRERPNAKIQLGLLSGKDRFELSGAKDPSAGLDPFPGFLIGFFNLYPESRGYVHAISPDPKEAPEIDPRYLTEEHDRQEMIAALKLSRKISQQAALSDFVVRETRPSEDVRSDDEMLDYIRQSGQTSYHPVGTCRMGSDPNAVVDPELRVRGIQGLRVVDSSIMPTICGSNTNAGSIMIGEKGADLILADGA
ncbi:MAG: GMC family oxidoreductase N-terminal domain-containing protein [Alphaproteobacteria bacterium]